MKKYPIDPDQIRLRAITSFNLAIRKAKINQKLRKIIYGI